MGLVGTTSIVKPPHCTQTVNSQLYGCHVEIRLHIPMQLLTHQCHQHQARGSLARSKARLRLGICLISVRKQVTEQQAEVHPWISALKLNAKICLG